MFRSFSLIPFLVPISIAAYTLVDDYTPSNFAEKFNFFTGNDPTNGYVNYVDQSTAQSSGLYSVSNNQVYIGVDATNVATGRGRNSVRIESKASYQHGLIILDLAHMPGGQCGSWPAFWLLSTSATWPNGGEVDIIEGVNSNNYNTMGVHTNAGCSISNDGGMSGQIVADNCDAYAPEQPTNQGCSITTGNSNSYGTGFNAVGGGVYATQWTSDGLSIWVFPRGAIPSDISSGNPDPSGWGLPISKFQGACDWDEKVVNQQVIFDVTFCGDWAGNDWLTDTACSSRANSCQAFVQNTPSAFTETFWSINSLKIYQENGQSTGTTTSRSVTTTFTAVTSPSLSTLTTLISTGTTYSSSTAVVTSTFAGTPIGSTISVPGLSETLFTTLPASYTTFSLDSTPPSLTISLLTATTAIPTNSYSTTYTTSVATIYGTTTPTSYTTNNPTSSASYSLTYTTTTYLTTYTSISPTSYTTTYPTSYATSFPAIYPSSSSSTYVNAYLGFSPTDSSFTSGPTLSFSSSSLAGDPTWTPATFWTPTTTYYQTTFTTFVKETYLSTDWPAKATPTASNNDWDKNLSSSSSWSAQSTWTQSV